MLDRLERPRLAPPSGREQAQPAPEPPAPRPLASVEAAAGADAEPSSAAAPTPTQQARAQRLAPGYRASPTVTGGRAVAPAAVQPARFASAGEAETAAERARPPERSRASASAGNPPPATGGGRGSTHAPERRPAASGYHVTRGASAANAKSAAPPAARSAVRRSYATTRGTPLGPLAGGRAATIQRAPGGGRGGYTVSAGPPIAAGGRAGEGAKSPLAPLMSVLPIQAKVEIGATDDPLEHEADRVAETVTSAPPARDAAPAPGGPAAPSPASAAPSGGLVQPMCACGSCPTCAARGHGGGAASIQRKPTSDGYAGGAATAHTGGDATPAREPHAGVEMGEPMSPEVRDRVEPVLGADLGGVRVHSGGAANAAAGSIGARAFTHGNHIWLGAGESARDHRLLAHEATHVVQQAGGAPASVQRDGGDDEGFFGKVGDVLGGAVSSVEEWTSDKIIGLVRRVSPLIADLISEGPGPMIQRAITSAVQSFLGSIGLGGVDLGSAWTQISTAFSPSTIVGLFQNKGGACDTFIAGINALRDLGSRFLDSPAVKAVESFFSAVGDVLGKVSQFVLAPAFDFLKTILGGAWDLISGIGKKIWAGLKAIKDAAGRAFDWVAKKLGFSGATGEGGVTEWISNKASEIWESIKAKIQPIIGPLKMVGGAIAMLTGVGELYLIIKYAPKVVQAVQWLWAHRNDPDIVKSAHQEMGDTILPQLLEAGSGIGDTLQSALTGFLGKLTSLGKGLLDLAGAVSGVPLLSMAQGFIQRVANGVQHAISWASEFVNSAVTAVKSGVQKLYAFIKPYIPVLMSLAAAILNPAMIPVILAGWAWKALPDCVKPPIIDLLLDAVIAILSKLPDFPLFGLLWPIIQHGVLGFLQKVRALGDEQKIAITNKVATIMTGSSPQFLLGFVTGLLKGIWMLVKMPFDLVWQLANGLVKLADWLGGAVEDFFTPTKDKEDKKKKAEAAKTAGEAGQSAAKPPTAATPTPHGAGAPAAMPAAGPKPTAAGATHAPAAPKPKRAFAPARMEPDEALLDARKRDSESVANVGAANMTPDNARATVAAVVSALKAHRASEPPATAAEARERAKANPSSTEAPPDVAAAVAASAAAGSAAGARAPTPPPAPTARPGVAAGGPAKAKAAAGAKPPGADVGAKTGKMADQLKPPAEKVASGFLPAVEQYFSGGGKSMTLDDLVGYLGKLWKSVLGAVEGAGATIAEKVTKLFLGEEAEDTLGDAIGQAVALIAGQEILDFFTAGLFEAVPILEELLAAPAEMMEEVFGLLKELGTYVVDGVKELGSTLSEAGGALGEVLGSLREIGEDLIKFGEELLEDLGLLSKEAAAGEAAVGEAGAAVGAAETGAAEMSAAETAAAEARAAEEAATAEEALTAEEKAAQEAEEAEQKAANEAEEKAEQKEAEHLEAEAEAAAITRAEDRAHVPVPIAVAALDELKAQFSWIDHFEAEAAGPSVSEIFMISSKTKIGEIDRFARSPEELAALGLEAEEESLAAQELAGYGEPQVGVYEKGVARYPGLSEAEAAEEAAAGEAAAAAEEEQAVKNVAQAQEEMGELEGAAELRERGYESSGYTNPIAPHGIDDLAIKDGKLSIIEYKGGPYAQLAKAKGKLPAQLTPEWLEDVLERMEADGGEMGAAWAKMIRNQGRIDIVLVETKASGETVVTHLSTYLGKL